jgi:peptide/nickel transport system substrate-binding protein
MQNVNLGRRRRASRRRSLLAVFVVAGLVAGACGDDGDSPDAAPESEEESISNTTIASEVDDVTTGGTVIMGLEAEANSYLPGESTNNTNVARAIYDSIAARGADGEVHPYLAESIEPNDDLTEWTITLREGIVFHDGTPLDAEGIKANFDDYVGIPESSLAGTVASIEEVRVDGPLTYTYVLDAPDAAFPDILTGSVGYPFSNEACIAAGDNCGSQPVGAGPFKLVSWQRDSEIRLERNENYWRTDDNGVQLPYLDELIFRPIPDETSRLAAVRSGDTQVGQTLRQSVVRQAQEAAEAGDIQSLEALGNNGGGSIFNVLTPPVDDVRVRQALVHATDQDVLIDVLGGTGLTPAQTQFFSPESPWFSATVEEEYPDHDPALAEQLLQEYIDDPERSDGKAPGEPISVRYQCPSDPSLIAIAQAYQSFWSAVGVEVDLEQVEQAALITNAIGSADQTPPFSGTYMITCFRMGSDSDPYTALAPAFGDPATSPGNIANYKSESIDEQLEVLRTEPDFEARYGAVETMMLELAEQVPLMWTGGTATSLYAVNEVQNLGGWTTPDGALGTGVLGSTIYWSEVWLEQ